MLAFCSMVYEFLMAQSLAAVMGNSVLRYNTTIGLYVAALGFGALLLKRLHAVRDPVFLIKVEVALAVLGGLGPLAALAVGPFLSHAWIVAIGFLSGYEMPLLMEYAEAQRRGAGARALALDYGGMICGAVLFPLVLMPSMGLFQLGFGVAALNGILAALWALLCRRRGWLTVSILISLALVAGSVCESQYRDAFVDAIYLREPKP